MEIPKIIHYCWFGRNQLPEDAVKCINSWKKFFPGYEIREWNEDNFDINICAYVKEAYDNKRWAFVSDYARFWILYNYGGLYFDTDVEAIKSFDDILRDGPYMGCEPAKGKDLTLANGVVVNPGLGMGAYPGMTIYKDVLDYYNKKHFDADDLVTVCRHTTTILVQHGFKGINGVEYIDNVKIYPIEYFCPMNYFTGELSIGDNTHSIHHYSETWHTEREMKFRKIKDKLEHKYGDGITKKFLFKVFRNLYCYGVVESLKRMRRRHGK
ncbi:MAG: glycosyltransferase family 32 protein [Lacrimispora saccharolytica]